MYKIYLSIICITLGTLVTLYSQFILSKKEDKRDCNLFNWIGGYLFGVGSCLIYIN